MAAADRSPTGLAPVLQVHPTRRCNLACAHCYTSSGPRVREELAVELLSAALSDAVALGYRRLAVSGGEPLLYSPLATLLTHARRLGMVTTITTNGMLTTPERWEPLAALVDVAAVSIDGIGGDHDALRRCPGAFARTVANLATLRRSGVAFGLIFTLTQHNVDALEHVVRLAAEHGARGVQVHPLTLQGRAAEALTGARPDGIELIAALAEASRLGGALGVTVSVDAVSRQQLVAYRDHFVPGRPVRSLPAVAPILIIAADGSVVPLTHDLAPHLRLGSIVEAPLAALARAWLASDAADRLAASCAGAWTELTSDAPAPAAHWYDAVANRSYAA